MVLRGISGDPPWWQIVVGEYLPTCFPVDPPKGWRNKNLQPCKSMRSNATSMQNDAESMQTLAGSM